MSVADQYQWDYQAELNTEDHIGGLYAGETRRRHTVGEALADALALQTCRTVGEAQDTGLTTGIDSDVHPRSPLMTFRIVRNLWDDNGGWVNHDDNYTGPQGTYKLAQMEEVTA